MPTRQLEWEGKIFCDSDDKPHNGEMFYDIPDDSYTTGFLTTILHFKDGKIHGSPAIIYPDGMEEEWDNGAFVKVIKPPYAER